MADGFSLDKHQVNMIAIKSIADKGIWQWLDLFIE